MKRFWITAIAYAIFGHISPCEAVNLTFPDNFKIGVGSAAYQIEGAWNDGGKGESIWDYWTHNHPEEIADGSNGDVAANAYYNYKEDVQLIKSLGLDFYRFSISWSRVLPTGRACHINHEGLQYYKNLTDELLNNGITPIVTIYHWDHPQVLEEEGGWTNEKMAYWYADYARILFKALGDRVKIWVTINEPNIFCSGSYEGLAPPGTLAPGKKLEGYGAYLCMHNILKAHAIAYHIYDEEFRDTQKGEIGLTAHCRTFVTDDENDKTSAETAVEFDCGWVYNPIYIGDYPEIMKKRVALVSEAQGYETSRLPEFTDEWISYIRGTADYLGVNHYGSGRVEVDPDEEKGIYNSDSGLIYSYDPSWPATFIPGLYVTPFGLYDLLVWIKDKYGNPPVRIMENGLSTAGELEDYDRITFHYEYLTALLEAVQNYACNVISYSIWCLLDDFEWNSGYPPKFGIFSIDFNDPDRARTPRLSASWWSSVLENHELQPVPTKE